MNLKILDSNDNIQMVELLKSERLQPGADFYLDRGASFWGLYNWFSGGNNLGIGVFDKETLVGMVSSTQLPFKIRETKLSSYLVSDFFVHPHYRKTFAAARLFSGLHKFPPERNALMLFIEHQPGVAEPISKVCKKFGHSSIWARESVLTSLFANQKISIESRNYQFQASQDWDQIDRHLERFVSRSNTWAEWTSAIKLKDVFRHVWYFQYAQENFDVAGLIIDRGNLQRVCWSGQPRMYIEKHNRRLKNGGKHFRVGDELTFCNVCFVLSSDVAKGLPKELVSELSLLAFENEFFCLNFRDMDIQIPNHIDHTRFPRRVVFCSDHSYDELDEVRTKNQTRRVMIEPVYL